MAAILTKLQDGDVLFVDEIHRLNRQVEVLYPAMEDYVIDIVIGKGPSAVGQTGSAEVYPDRGATTRAGSCRTSQRPLWRGEPDGVLYTGGAG